MPLTSDNPGRPDKLVNITDHFAIKNFILSDNTSIPADHSLDEAIIFDGFMLTICLKGEALFRLNYREFRVSEGMIFTYIPGQMLHLVERSEDLIIENLFVSVDYMLRFPIPKDFALLKKMGEEPVRRVSGETIHNMLELHAVVAKYHRMEKNSFRELQTSGLLFALLMELGCVYADETQYTTGPVSRQELLADEFFGLLLEHFRTERKVAFYADKLFLTPKYLSMTIKKVTGHPISDWINLVVIIEAKRLLKATDMTALQISEELNFPNPSFFGRFFRQYAGMTPLQYKNS